MGLDMYLTGKRYLSKYFNEGDEKAAEHIAEEFPELDKIKSRNDGSPVKEVRIEAGYWRKANAIHDWFVKNVQGGEDECRPHYVTREQLKQLREICVTVMENPTKAPELLPTASGFFFGSTDYDKWYFDDLRLTVQIIDDVLTLPESWDFEYCSSW